MEEHRNPRRSRRLAYQRARLQQGLLMSVILLGTILCLTLGSLLTPDRTYSDSENRKLAQFPKLSWSAVNDGSWFSDLESYTADQFAGRDFWIALRLRFLKLTGQKESNGVYLCSGDPGKRENIAEEPPDLPVSDGLRVEGQRAVQAQRCPELGKKIDQRHDPRRAGKRCQRPAQPARQVRPARRHHLHRRPHEGAGQPRFRREVL